MDSYTPNEIPQIQEDEFLPQINSWITGGGATLVSLFSIAVILTSVLEYNVAVKTQATIRPVGDNDLVQSAIEGKVNQIKVSNHQKVKTGDIIARLDDSRLQTKKNQLQDSIEQSQLQISQIEAQVQQLNSQLQAQNRLIKRNIAAAEAEFRVIQRNYRDQKIIAQNNFEQARASENFAQIELQRIQQEKTLQATVEEAEASLRLAKAQRNRMLPILRSGAISRNFFEEKQQSVKAAQAKLEQAKSASRTLLAEKQQAVIIARTNVNKARSAINPVNATVTAVKERINQEKAKGEATVAALNKELQTLFVSRGELKRKLQDSIEEIKLVNKELQQTIIRAPVSGTILQLNLHNPEQVLRPGEIVARIAPDNAALEIKAQVEARDIDKVKPKQKVQIQVSACPYPDFGTFKGTVKKVAADSTPVNPENTNLPKLAAYEVTIKPDKLFAVKDGKKCYLLPGMEGKASIISRRETIMQFVLRKARIISNL
ncbi:MAG: HlyD family efflux transporter periplasmic adaptor subunit [Rivularia sp. (in: Bacteria)]|nr:HlyD family efflux transporter periplasmic adaptor subunit [Rivularia sp. MS3]